MLDSNPSQKIKVGWRGTPFTFIAHAGLPPGYSHPCQTPWSVFLDGSDVPVPSAGLSRAPKTWLTKSPPGVYPALRIAADQLTIVHPKGLKWVR